jgi:hypothetical protein
MNKVKLFSTAIVLATTLAVPASAEGRGGGGEGRGGGGGMAATGGGGGGMSAGGGQGAGRSMAAPSGVSFSGMRANSGNVGPSGRTFATEGGRERGWSGERHERGGERHGRGGRSGFAFGAGYGYGYGSPYGYDSYAYDDGGCYLVRRRVMTRFGWRLRRVQVCD